MESKNLRQHTMSKEELLTKLGIHGEWMMCSDDGEDFNIIVEVGEDGKK